MRSVVRRDLGGRKGSATPSVANSPPRAHFNMDGYPSLAHFYGDEREIHVMALNDFRSTVYADGVAAFAAWEYPVDFDLPPPTDYMSPVSPSSVTFLPSSYLLKPIAIEQVVVPEVLRVAHDSGVCIKAEPKPFENPAQHYLEPLPIHREALPGYITDNERERLRRRQRSYEQRYRGRKRRDLKLQRETWLGLEMKLAALRKKHGQPATRCRRLENESTRSKLERALRKTRLLRLDMMAMQTLRAWEQISRIREYTDKDELRTVSEWQHNAEKVLRQCSMVGPQRFNPYAPQELRFSW